MTDAAETTPTVADLLARARVYVESSHAKQTLEAYAADGKHFTTWCDEHKRRSLPAAPETIICYLVETADSYRLATLDRRLASISSYHCSGTSWRSSGGATIRRRGGRRRRGPGARSGARRAPHRCSAG